MDKTKEQILDECIDGWYEPNACIDGYSSDVHKAMEQFGKQCFEAGRKYMTVSSPISKSLDLRRIKYLTFEDYLKQLK